ncbi:MAG: methionyl-tRNA formyltransferase [Lacrimispora saccharolytica]
MKLVYMGTPDFAVPPLTALVEAGHEVAAVVTQPDRPKGRGKTVLMTPVKEKALSYGIPVYQPARVKKDEEFLKTLREINPDAIVVAAFGQILPKEILELPKYGCVNIHASLLPKYRGAAPIQWAVIDGEKESGITTMMMDVGLDTGDMLDRTVIPLAEDETGGSLFEKLSRAGGPLILKTLEALENGTAVRTKQPEEGATYAGMLDKSLGNIDWTQSAAKIERLIRGLNPWPSAYTGYKGKTMKLWAADVLEGTFEGVPGEIIKVEKEHFLVRTGDGALAVKELQLEGKKRMDAASFLRGFSLEEGEILCQG